MGSATLKCSSCGYANLATMSACSMCGQALGAGAPAAPQAAGAGDVPVAPGVAGPMQVAAGDAPQPAGHMEIYRSGMPAGSESGLGSSVLPMVLKAAVVLLVPLLGVSFVWLFRGADWESSTHGFSMDVPSGWTWPAGPAMYMESRFFGDSGDVEPLIGTARSSDQKATIDVFVLDREAIEGATPEGGIAFVPRYIGWRLGWGDALEADPPAPLDLGGRAAQRVTFRFVAGDHQGQLGEAAFGAGSLESGPAVALGSRGVAVLTDTPRSNKWLLAVGICESSAWAARGPEIEASLASIRSLH